VKNSKPFQRFYEAIQTDKTSVNYVLWFNQFCNYSKIDPDRLTELKSEDVEDLVFNWIVHLKRRSEKGELNPNSLRPMLAPIQLYCERNRITLDWKGLKKYLPKRVPTKNQEAWTGDEIKKMLNATTSLRNKAIIHFLASTGARIGALHDLNKSDITEIEDGAVVWIYNKDLERYRTCLTPESYNALKDYWDYRIERGYPITRDDQPVFCKRDNKTRITYDGSREILIKIQQRAGVRSTLAENKITSKSPNHGFRKRFEKVLVNSGIHSKTIETFCGSIEMSRDQHYYKYTITDEELWNEFKKTLPILTINESEQLKLKNQQQKDELMKYEVEAKTEIESIKKELHEQRLVTLKLIKEAISNPEKFVA